MTTIVYKNGILATDTNSTINQVNLAKSGIVIDNLLNDPTTDDVDRGILLRTKGVIDDGVTDLGKDGKFIILTEDQQFQLHDGDEDNEVIAIAGAGNMLALVDLKHWLDGTRKNIDEFWYRYNTRLAREVMSDRMEPMAFLNAAIELMFITKKGCYTWSVDMFDVNCLNEAYHSNNGHLAIVMGSGAQRFTDEIMYRVPVAEVEGEYTPEELVKIAMNHDAFTGGEVKTFIYH